MKRLLVIIFFALVAIVAIALMNRGIESQRRAVERAADEARIMQAATKLLGRPPKDFAEAWSVVSADLVNKQAPVK